MLRSCPCSLAAQTLAPQPNQPCRYEEDILNAKKLGCNSFRFSLEWARLEPKQGQIDQDAVKRQAPYIHMSRVISCAVRLQGPSPG